MKRKRNYLFIGISAVFLQLVWLMAACQQQVQPIEVTRIVERNVTVIPPTAEPSATPEPEPTATPVVITATVVVEVTPPVLGSPGRPVQLLIPPVTGATVILARAEGVVEALEQATGVEFAVGIPDDEQAMVDLLCAAPGDTIAILSATAYTIAHDRCDVQAVLVAGDSDDMVWEAGMLLARADSGIQSLEDLDGKRWVIADGGNMAIDLYFRALLAEAGIEPAEIVTAPEATSALLAVRNGEADFATAEYLPPIMPNNREWVFGETDPEVWRLVGLAPVRSPIGYVVVAGEPVNGGYRLRDARARLFDTTRDIFNVTRILALSAPIPRETVVLGADFPYGLARTTLQTLTEFVASEMCQPSLCSTDLYGWTGLEPIEDTAYDPIRFVANALDLAPESLWDETD